MFEDNMEIAVVKIDGKYFDVTASYHARKRMVERNVDKYVVAGSVIALGPERIAKFQKNNDEAIIIDEENNASVVVGFSETEISIITVIDKSNVFVKSNTQICRI